MIPAALTASDPDPMSTSTESAKSPPMNAPPDAFVATRHAWSAPRPPKDRAQPNAPDDANLTIKASRSPADSRVTPCASAPRSVPSATLPSNEPTAYKLPSAAISMSLSSKSGDVANVTLRLYDPFASRRTTNALPDGAFGAATTPAPGSRSIVLV